MAGAISFKAMELRDALAADLAQRSSLAVAKSFDTVIVGAPVISWGTVTAGSQGAVIRVVQLASVGTDILGLTQNVFSPTIIQVCVEASSVSGCPLVTLANMGPLLGECMGRGVRVELYLSANGTAPSTSASTGMLSTTLKFTFDPSLQYPLAGQ